MAKLQSGTVCLIRRTGPDKEHDGKVVQVERYFPQHNGYQCTPDLMCSNGFYAAWQRHALVPLNGGDGQDEMLRIVGKPKKTRAKRPQTAGPH